MISTPLAAVPLYHASMAEPLQTYAIACPLWIEIASEAPPPCTLPA